MAPQSRLHCRCQKCTLGGAIPEGTLVCLSTYRNHQKGIGVIRKSHRLPAANNGQEILHCHCALCAIHFGAAGRPFTSSGLVRHLRRNQARIESRSDRSVPAAAAATDPATGSVKIWIQAGVSQQLAHRVETKRDPSSVVVDAGPESSCGSS